MGNELTRNTVQSQAITTSVDNRTKSAKMTIKSQKSSRRLKYLKNQTQRNLVLSNNYNTSLSPSSAYAKYHAFSMTNSLAPSNKDQLKSIFRKKSPKCAHSLVMDQLQKISGIKDELHHEGQYHYDVQQLSQMNNDRIYTQQQEKKNRDFKISKSFSQMMQLNQRRL
jgi:hypothetical protein